MPRQLCGGFGACCVLSVFERYVDIVDRLSVNGMGAAKTSFQSDFRTALLGAV